MTGTSYVPGTWLGILRSRTAVLLGPDTTQATAGAVWELLESKPAVHEVLHAITGSSGGSLTRIPPFGILDFSGPLRVFLRGDLDLAVELPDGRVELDGRDVTTWNERRFALSGACRISIPAGGSGDQPELPLGEGVVLLQSLVLGLGPARPELAPAPAAAVAVDSAGVADRREAAPGTDEPREITIVPEPEPEPEPEASAETVLAVPDDDAQVDAYISAYVDEGDVQPAGAGPGMEAGAGTEPSAQAETAEYQPAQAAIVVSDQTSSYDHLWERTVIRSIEGAAVREEAEVADAGSFTDSAGAGTADAVPRAEEHNAPVVLNPGGDAKAAVTEAPSAVEHAPGVVAAPAVDHPPAVQQPAGVLIDSVPWKKVPGTAAAAAADAAPGPAPVPATVPATPPANAAFDDDHDGQTVMKGSIGASPAQPAPAAVADPQAGPTVLARVCSQGHANPPTRAQCAACGAGLHPDAVQVPRPRLGRVRLSTGELLDLDQSLVIGRQPSVSRVQGGVMPRLVQVPSLEGDISRSHVEVRLEGWHVMLCDLKATNGTVLVREGQPPRRLAQNEMAILLDGDIAELGDNISLRFEEIP
ncbi:FHA domain-containing protein [Pseudarthrobacter sp. C1]|uniref:FHA domain-containing protein n=1 Tax=Pseudarthrobacter sp. C1 TaxID=3108940 RepID=UPI002B053B28|nr:FHA domain-containing protein [Pseudarthrobacter sp. C1]MEA3551681.1 FHA domain-containing protein [Pseudarthrobacter sp. C1]